MSADGDRFDRLRARCDAGRAAVIGEIERLARSREAPVGDLSSLLLDYPLRPAKALRPTLCLSVAAALGADTAAALPSAAAIELLHNAFLIHDDVEDGSRSRRGGPTLHEIHGVPTAVNVADGMFALSLYPLLDNCEHLGIGPALALIESMADMVRITVEGQAIELAWIRDNRWDFGDVGYRDAYVDLVIRKTAHYSFVTPATVGCIVAAAEPALRHALERYAKALGVAFQITDDILNLEGDEDAYGKERDGDLWEGKRTLILMHAIAREGPTPARERALRILSRPRPAPASPAARHMLATLERLLTEGRVAAEVHAELVAAAQCEGLAKSDADIEFLRDLIRVHDSVEAARHVAVEHCELARDILHGIQRSLRAGAASTFLRDLVAYVTDRLA